MYSTHRTRYTQKGNENLRQTKREHCEGREYVEEVSHAVPIVGADGSNVAKSEETEEQVHENEESVVHVATLGKKNNRVSKCDVTGF